LKTLTRTIIHTGDIHPTDGVQHAEAIANYLAQPSSPTPNQIYASPFLRTTHTASIIGKTLSLPIRIEEGLYEWLKPSLLVERSTGIRTYPQSVAELKERFTDIEQDYVSVNPLLQESESKVLVEGAPSFPEEMDALLLRCNTTIQRLLRQTKNYENVAIVSHAPCIQAMAFALEEDISDPKDSKLGPWPSAGLTKFSREIRDEEGSTCCGKWELDYFGKTEHLPGEYRKGMNLWSLPCFL